MREFGPNGPPLLCNLIGVTNILTMLQKKMKLSPSDSFMVADDDLNIGELRTLTVDNYLVLPTNTSIRVLCTSMDVIHAFALPSIGVKADCYPGR